MDFCMDVRNKKGVGLGRLVGGLTASAVMLTVIQAPANVHLLAWVAWVPFVLACQPEVRQAADLLDLSCRVYLLAVQPVVAVAGDGAGYIVFAALAVGVLAGAGADGAVCAAKTMALTLFVPVIVVGAEAIKACCSRGLRGFLALSSVPRPAADSDLRHFRRARRFGGGGVVNGLIADGVLEWTARETNRTPVWVQGRVYGSCLGGGAGVRLLSIGANAPLRPRRPAARLGAAQRAVAY